MGRQQNLTEFYEKVGISNVLLKKVENEESNIGNVITDSMVHFTMWNDTEIAFINNGGIRGTIDPGEITGEDVIQVLPFGSTIGRVTMYGKSIKGIFEEYAQGLCPEQTCEPPTFLQMSGLKVVYDIYPNASWERVTSIKKNCGDDWCDLEMEKLYPVAITSFLARGGSYLHSFPQWFEDHNVGGVDYLSLKHYIQSNSPINMTTEGRITINYHTNNGNSYRSNILSVFLMILAFYIRF